MENPFSIFPEELWNMILPNMDLIEAQHFLQAMPELFTTLNKLFGVLHFTYESDQFFKQARSSFNQNTAQLISRRWCSAVYNFVTNSPLHVGQSKLEFRYLINLDDTLPTLRFKTAEKIRSFNNASTLHTVHFSCPPIPGFGRPNETFKACVQFLKNYGSNIKILTLDFTQVSAPLFGYSFDSDAGDFPPECLGSLTNLHTLSVNFLSLEYWSDVSKPPDNFPQLPCLRNLEVYDSTDNVWENRFGVVGFLIRGYIFKGQVKNFRVTSKQDLFICKEEFELDKICRTYTNFNEFRSYIRGHNLKRVTIKPKKKKRELLVNSVMLWLQTEGMNPTEICFEQCTNLKTKSDDQFPNMPRIKYMKITDYVFLQYRFLSGLTSLEHLCVECDNEDHVNMFDYRSSDCFTNVIRCYLYNDTVGPEVDVWTKLPSLKSFLVLGKDGTCKHFVRCLGNKPVVYTK